MSNFQKTTFMKHKGSILAFTSQRNEELMNAYRNAISNVPFIDIDTVAEQIANSPCSRFWVSEERALIIIHALDNKKNILDSMSPMKRELFTEIYSRVNDLRSTEPAIPIHDIVFRVVNSPAPKFYLQPRCALDIIYKIKNGFYNK